MSHETDFGALVEAHRRELRAHCYRMLGSLADAEDATQDTMLRAFRAADALESPRTVRAWLYQIATNVCLDRLARRPSATEIHVEPCPPAFWESTDAGPEARISARESVALAFMVALHELPPLQRAVLLLRDVMGWSASEVAELLDQSVASVNSALQRARERCPAPIKRPTLDATMGELLTRYVRAWESRDAGALASLLRDDALITMPPQPAVQGKDAIRELFTRIFGTMGELRVREIDISGGRGIALYVRPPNDTELRAYMVQTVEPDDEGTLAVLHTFRDPALFAAFALPPIAEER